MISSWLLHIRNFCEAKFLRLAQVVERILVILQLEFSQAQRSPSRSKLRVSFGEFIEHRNRIGKTACVGIESAQIPPALRPIGTDLERGLVVADRRTRTAFDTRSTSLPRKSIEILRRILSRD